MLTENRKYNFVGELTLHKSNIANAPHQPKDDKVNWLFLNTGERQFSFVYKIGNPLEARYGSPFKADLAFTMIEAVQDIINLNQAYEVLRGQEIIGTVRIINALE
ncbi:hypothetical protein [Arachidicoccus soli]|uniref:Uncharacterized protein n=1 Tax=Arachidicoccus soli TaxID=2341117 RepID=A0A386HR03_9BACT|nr:hypothetical protein [Arachidicoccus soli]AYD48089.1 hypothetical protein D6B99_11095 [Arachidicoccus soli]